MRRAVRQLVRPDSAVEDGSLGVGSNVILSFCRRVGDFEMQEKIAFRWIPSPGEPARLADLLGGDRLPHGASRRVAMAQIDGKRPQAGQAGEDEASLAFAALVGLGMGPVFGVGGETELFGESSPRTPLLKLGGECRRPTDMPNHESYPPLALRVVAMVVVPCRRDIPQLLPGRLQPTVPFVLFEQPCDIHGDALGRARRGPAQSVRPGEVDGLGLSLISRVAVESQIARQPLGLPAHRHRFHLEAGPQSQTHVPNVRRLFRFVFLVSFFSLVNAVADIPSGLPKIAKDRVQQRVGVPIHRHLELSFFEFRFGGQNVVDQRLWVDRARGVAASAPNACGLVLGKRLE